MSKYFLKTTAITNGITRKVRKRRTAYLLKASGWANQARSRLLAPSGLTGECLSMRRLAQKNVRQKVDALPLPLISSLCGALQREQITYCHWKSNWKLNDWARGQGDLDLLVARPDAQRFLTILSSLGFRQALPPANKQVPGIENFYGFDHETTSFVHVHAHYQLALGHDLTKNYHLPLEEPYLESAVRRGLFEIAAPEFELILFVVRMVLKFSIFDSLFLRSQAISSGALQKELEYLERQVEAAKVEAILKKHLPFIDTVFFETCRCSLQLDCPIWRRVAVRQQLRSRLKAHARSPQAVATLLTFERWMMKLIHRMSRLILATGSSSRKRLGRGGALIALVGGDGAGKTTSLDALYSWLSNKFDTRRVHLGKPPRSLITWAVVVLLRIRKLFSRSPEENPPTPSGNESDSSVFPGYLQLLRWVCAARDRYRLYVKARRFATNGGLVICDRYPIAQLKLMDGPNICRFVDKLPKNRLAQSLLTAERGYYQQILSPDLLIVLRVDPELAVQRKTNEPALHVRTRSQELWEVDWQDPHVHVVDASQPAKDVLRSLQSIIWNQL